MIKMPLKDKRIFNAGEAAKIIGISKETLVRYERENKIPSATRNPINGWRQYRLKDIRNVMILLGRKF